jgi:hypothetical protein
MVEYVASMEETRNAYAFLVEKPETRKPLKRSGNR